MGRIATGNNSVPENIPKAVIILIWLLSGVILFGWLLLEYSVLFPLVFALLFFGLPVLAYTRIKK